MLRSDQMRHSQANRDFRIQKTQTQLRQALMTLLQTQHMSQISVADLTREAGITRSTFYLHYADKNEFVDQVGNELQEAFFKHVIAYTYTTEINAFPVMNLERTFAFLAESHQDYLLIDQALDGQFSTRIDHEVERLLKLFAAENDLVAVTSEPPIEMVIQYMVTSHMGFIRQWLDSGMIYSAPYMAKMLKALGEVHTPGLERLNDFFIAR